MSYKFYLNGDKIQTIYINNNLVDVEMEGKLPSGKNNLVINSFTYNSQAQTLTINAKITDVALPGYYVTRNYNFFLIPILYNKSNRSYMTFKHRRYRKQGLPAWTDADDKPRVYTSASFYRSDTNSLDDFKITDYNNIQFTINTPLCKTGKWIEYNYQNKHTQGKGNTYIQKIGFMLACQETARGGLPYFYLKKFTNVIQIEYIFNE